MLASLWLRLYACVLSQASALSHCCCCLSLFLSLLLSLLLPALVTFAATALSLALGVAAARSATCCVFVLVSHSPKTKGKRARGSSGRRARGSVGKRKRNKGNLQSETETKTRLIDRSTLKIIKPSSGAYLMRYLQPFDAGNGNGG